MLKVKASLENRQKELNKKYEEQGLTDEILEEQIKINQLRHEHDIPDEEKMIYKEYVQ